MAKGMQGEQAHQAATQGEVSQEVGENARAAGASSARAVRDSAAARKPSASAAQREFYRAATEDDDGYDPYSDRRPEPEPLFQEDPWR